MTPLRQRMLDDMELRRFSPHTKRAYMNAVVRLSKFFNRSPDKLTKEEVRTFLLDLVKHKKVSPSLFNQCRCAFLFFYRVTVGRDFTLDRILCQPYAKKLPIVLSQDEVVQFFNATRNLKQRAMFMLMYAAGLRVSEVVNLQASAIDSKKMMLHVVQGKGRKDRMVMLSEKLLPVLREYWSAYRPTQWFFFSGKERDRQLTTNDILRVCYTIRRRAKLTKRITPHTFRHTFATHLLDAGTDLRTIQTLLGHRSLRTTAIYTLISPARVSATKSPLDLLDLEGKAPDEGKVNP